MNRGVYNKDERIKLAKCVVSAWVSLESGAFLPLYV